MIMLLNDCSVIYDFLFIAQHREQTAVPLCGQRICAELCLIRCYLFIVTEVHAIKHDIYIKWYCPASQTATRKTTTKKNEVDRVSSWKSPWTPKSLHSHPATLQTSTHTSVPPYSIKRASGLFDWARDRPLRFSVVQILEIPAVCLLMCPEGWQKDRQPLCVAVAAPVSIFIFLLHSVSLFLFPSLLLTDATVCPEIN